MTVLADTRPVRRFYLGLAAEPYDALSTVAWTEIPNTQVKSSTIRWGAQHELARVEASYCSLLLDNVNGEFEALNTASAYYPNLRPLNRLRIIDTWAGVDYIRFTGYVAKWPRSWNGINQATVTIEAWDALGAVLNGVDVPAWPWELEVRKVIEEVPSTGKAVWLRLNESSGTLAADSSGYNLDGQYQGTPTLGVAGLHPDGDKAAEFPSGSRVSLPYKNLLSAYPWTLACTFRSGTDNTGLRMLFTAYDGPATPRQYLQVMIADDSFGADAAKIIALAVNPYPTGTQVKSTITVDDNGTHRFVLSAESSTTWKLYLDGADRTAVSAATAHTFPDDLATGYAVGNTPAVAFGDFRFSAQVGDVLDEVLILDGLALSAAQVSRLYAATIPVPDVGGLANSGSRLAAFLEAVGWPAADTDIDVGLTTVQQGYVAGSALSYMQRLEVTEGGRLFVSGDGVITFHDRHRILTPPYTVSQATFGEDHAAGEIGYVGPLQHGEDDTDIRNDVQRGNVGGRVQVRRDKTSKARHGWKTHAITDMLGTSDQEALDRANRDLSLYKDPVTRFRSVTIKPQEDAAQGTVVWPKLLGLGQNSRVTMKARPPGLASSLSQESHVEHFDETVTPKDWQITLGLSAAQTSEFWVLGTSALGTGTRLSYLRRPRKGMHGALGVNPPAFGHGEPCL